MNYAEELNQKLVETCNEFGFSYGGDPVALVRKLFQLLIERGADLNKANIQRIEWVEELRAIVNSAPVTLRQGADPILAVKNLVEELKEQQSRAAQNDETATHEAERSLAVDYTKLASPQLAALIHTCVAVLQSRAEADYP